MWLRVVSGLLILLLSGGILSAKEAGVLGKPAPDWQADKWFHLPDDKTSLSVADFKGKVLYLYFFQAWDHGHQTHGLTSLKKVRDYFKGNSKVEFVAIQTVFEGSAANTPRKARDSFVKRGVKIPLGHDEKVGLSGSITLQNYKAGGTPWTVIIDRKGVVRYNNYFSIPQKSIKLVEKLLGEPVPLNTSQVERKLKRLSRDLLRPNPSVQEEAVREIVRLGAPAVPYLVKGLKKGGKEDKILFCSALAELGPQAEPAIGDLLVELGSWHRDVRRGATRTLAEIGPKSIPHLMRSLAHPQWFVRTSATTALIEIGTPSVRPLIYALRTGNALAREKAAYALGEIGRPAQLAIPLLIEAIRHPKEPVRVQAVIALGKIGPYKISVVDPLISKLRDSRWAVRGYAAWSLGKIHLAQEEEKVKLKRLIASRDWRIRTRASTRLAEVKQRPQAIGAVPHLINTLRDPHWFVQSRAIQALSEMEALNPLVQALWQNDNRLRANSMRALAKMEKRAASSGLALVSILNDQDNDVRTQATQTLGEVKAPFLSVVSALATTSEQGLQDTLPQVRRAAAVTLGRLKSLGKEAVPQLVLALTKDEDDRVQFRAAQALGRMGTPAVSSLVTILRNEQLSLRVRSLAAYALWYMGPQASPALTKLLEYLREINALSYAQIKDRESTMVLDERDQIQIWVIDIIIRLGNRGQPSARILLETLKTTSSSQVRQRAVLALATLESASLPLLAETLSDDREEINRGVQDALGQMGVIAVSELLKRWDEIPQKRVKLNRELLEETDESSVLSILTQLGKGIVLQSRIVHVLGEIGTPAYPAVKRLIGLLSKSIELPEMTRPINLWSPAVQEEYKQLARSIAHLQREVARSLGYIVQIDPKANLNLKDLFVQEDWPAILARAENHFYLRQEVIEGLIPKLSHRNWKVRQVAVQALGRIGEQAVPLLASALSAGDWRRRAGAARALGLMRDKGRGGVAKLVARLADPRDEVVAQVAWALGEIGDSSAGAVTKLVSVMDRVPTAAARALGEMRQKSARHYKEFVKRYKNQSPQVKSALLLALGQMGRDEREILDVMKQGLADQNWQVRLAASRALATMGPLAKGGVGELIQALYDDYWYVRRAAGEALVQIGPATVTPLTAHLDRWMTRRLADEVLGQSGSRTSPVLSMSRSSLLHREVRRQMLYILGRIGPRAASATTLLLKVIQSKASVRVRAQAVWTLGRLGYRATRAVPTLIRMLEEEKSPRVRGQVAWALGHIDAGRTVVVKALVQALIEEGSPIVRTNLVEAMGNIGIQNGQALPHILRRAQRDSDYRVRRAAVIELSRLPTNMSREVLARSLINDPHEKVRYHCAEGLAQLEGGGEALEEGLKDPSPAVRRACRRALADLRND